MRLFAWCIDRSRLACFHTRKGQAALPYEVKERLVKVVASLTIYLTLVCQFSVLLSLCRVLEFRFKLIVNRPKST